MPPRKIYKSKKSARKYQKRKAKVSYPDRHNWKLEAGASVIYNSAPNVVTAKGSSVIGNVVKQRDNFYQFGGVFNFSLDQCVATNNFLAANFDRYKINAIKIRVIPEMNFASVVGFGTLPTMKVCYDYDDANVPTVGDVEVRRGKTYRLDKPFTINLLPKIGQQLYAGPSINNPPASYAAIKAGWCNMAQRQIPHYGVKFMCRDWYANTSPNDMQVRFIITYMLSVKEQLALLKPPSLVEETAPDSVELLDTNLNEPESGGIVFPATTTIAP